MVYHQHQQSKFKQKETQEKSEYIQRLFENDCADKDDFQFGNELFLEYVQAHSRQGDSHQWKDKRKDGAQNKKKRSRQKDDDILI